MVLHTQPTDGGGEELSGGVGRGWDARSEETRWKKVAVRGRKRVENVS